MAGVKGRSGGARPGAGRKPAPKVPPVLVSAEPIAPTVTAPSAATGEQPDMLHLLMQVALGQIQVEPLQVRAAIAAVQYTHRKIGESGKKEEKQAAADKAAGGKFGVRAPPRLVVGGKG